MKELLKETIDMTTQSMTMPMDAETREYYVMMGYDISENKASPLSAFSIADGVEATMTLSGGTPTARLRVRTESEVNDLEYIAPTQKINIQERVNDILLIAQHMWKKKL